MISVPNKATFYVSEAARILQIHRVTMYRIIDRGEIEVEYISQRITVIPRASLIAYLEKISKNRSQTANTVA